MPQGAFDILLVVTRNGLVSDWKETGWILHVCHQEERRWVEGATGQLVRYMEKQWRF